MKLFDWFKVKKMSDDDELSFINKIEKDITEKGVFDNGHMKIYPIYANEKYINFGNVLIEKALIQSIEPMADKCAYIVCKNGRYYQTKIDCNAAIDLFMENQ